MAWYDFVKRRALSPGAQGYSLDNFRLPTSALNGPSTMTLGHRNVLQPPQSPQFQFAVVQGLGGVTQGQLVGQPLFDLGSDGVPTGSLFE